MKLELLYVQLKFYKILEDSNKISVITSVSISSHSSELDSLSVMSPLSSELSSSSIVSRLIFCRQFDVESVDGKFVQPLHSQPGLQWLDFFLQPQLLVAHPFLQLHPFVKKFMVPLIYNIITECFTRN